MRVQERRERIKLHVTPHGVPCLWECGGGKTHTGSAMIIAGSDGKKKRALYIKKEGHLACLEHALIPVRVDDIVVTMSYHRLELIAEIFQIVSIDEEPCSDGERYAYVQRLALSDTKDSTDDEWSLEWDDESVAARYQEAVDAALDKVDLYHCRVPLYCVPPAPKKRTTVDPVSEPPHPLPQLAKKAN